MKTETRFVTICLSTLVAVSILVSGCSNKIRRSGQVDLYRIVADDNADKLKMDGKLVRRFVENESDLNRKRADVIPDFGDFARFPEDTITLQILSVYLEKFPECFRLSSHEDAVLMVDIWEDAGKSGPDNPSLTSVAFVAKDQVVPGRLNFTGHLGYGPAGYKVRPLKLRFTLMLVRKEDANGRANAVDVISKYAAMIPTYGVLSAPIAGVMRDLLLSQPDVVAFDFEATLLPLNPERLGKSPSALPAGAVGESRIELAEIAPYRVSSMDLFPGYSPVIGGQADFKAKDNWVSRLLQLPGATAELDDLRYKAIELGTKLAILKNKLEYIKTDVGTVKEDMDRIKGEYYLAKQTFDDINSIYLRKNKKCPDIEEKICKMRSDISHLKGELGRLEENRRIVKQKMQIPWLRYGLYALVETMRRTSAEVTGTWDGAPASSPPRDRCEDTYYLKDGRLYSENMPLRENYIVLSITPGQLEEDNENLKQASRESRSLLDKLSRSEEEINGVIKDTDDHANNLKLGFIKSHASVVASRVARSVNSKDDFINSMDAARDKYLSESSMCIDEKIVGIFNDVRDGWVSIYDKETSK